MRRKKRTSTAIVVVVVVVCSACNIQACRCRLLFEIRQLVSVTLTQNSTPRKSKACSALPELVLIGTLWNSEALMPFESHSSDSLDLRQGLCHPLPQKIIEWKLTTIVVVVVCDRGSA